jgi:hypothetical protein
VCAPISTSTHLEAWKQGHQHRHLIPFPDTLSTESRQASVGRSLVPGLVLDTQGEEVPNADRHTP